MAGPAEGFDHTSLNMTMGAHSRMQGLGGGDGGGSLAPPAPSATQGDMVQMVNGAAGQGFANLAAGPLRGLENAGLLKEVNVSGGMRIPSPVPGLAGGKSNGIFGPGK